MTKEKSAYHLSKEFSTPPAVAREEGPLGPTSTCLNIVFTVFQKHSSFQVSFCSKVSDHIEVFQYFEPGCLHKPPEFEQKRAVLLSLVAQRIRDRSSRKLFTSRCHRKERTTKQLSPKLTGLHAQEVCPEAESSPNRDILTRDHVPVQGRVIPVHSYQTDQN